MQKSKKNLTTTLHSLCYIDELSHKLTHRKYNEVRKNHLKSGLQDSEMKT